MQSDYFTKKNFFYQFTKKKRALHYIHPEFRTHFMWSLQLGLGLS